MARSYKRKKKSKSPRKSSESHDTLTDDTVTQSFRTSDNKSADEAEAQGSSGDSPQSPSSELGDATFKRPTTPPSRRASSSRRRSVSASAKLTGDGDQSRTPNLRPRTRRRAEWSTPATSLGAEDSLYRRVISDDPQMDDIVRYWIESYKDDKEKALLRLMQFFIDFSGCQGEVTPEMQASLSYSAIIDRMGEQLNEDSQYPLMGNDAFVNDFRTKYCNFLQILIYQCRNSILYDDYLLPNLIRFLRAMTDAQADTFRHTGTLAAVHTMTYLCEVAMFVFEKIRTVVRQIDAEKQKPREQFSIAKLETLKMQRVELKENVNVIQSLFMEMFDRIYKLKVKDVLAEVRRTCMAEIGIWASHFHANFFTSEYVDYIAYGLYDKAPEVRNEAVRTLQYLCISENRIEQLSTFITAHKNRIGLMARDKDSRVAIDTIKLITLVYRYDRAVFSFQSRERIYDMVYYEHKGLAQAAAEFLIEVCNSEEDAEDAARQARSSNSSLIKNLATFFSESDLADHCPYLADACIDISNAVRDWECMTNLLLQEPPLEEPLASALLELMVCWVRQVATGEAPPGRIGRKRQLSAAEKKKLATDKRKLTEHFVIVLPRLLDEFSGDAHKLSKLLEVPQHLQLDLYVKLHREEKLEELLKKIEAIVERMSDTYVLEAAAKTLEIMSMNDHPRRSYCAVSRATILDVITAQYREAIGEYRKAIKIGEKLNEEDATATVNFSRKVAVFSSCHDLTDQNLWRSLYRNVQVAADPRRALPEEATRYCIQACFFSLLWGKTRIKDEELDDPDAEAVGVAERLNVFISTMKNFMSEGNKSADLRDEAYKSICDLLVTFANKLHNETAALHHLVYEADPDLQNLLNEFVRKYVFSEDSEDIMDEKRKVEDVRRKRNLLAGYCKLIMFNMLPVRAAAGIFKHYVSHYNNFGDIIKMTLGKAREINKLNCTLTMELSLRSLYDDAVSEKGYDVNEVDLIAVKDLARRFALFFGLDAEKNGDAVTKLHVTGILYVVTLPDGSEIDSNQLPPNLPYLWVLAELSHKLPASGKTDVLQVLGRKFSFDIIPLDAENWRPLVAYRESLLPKGRGSSAAKGSKKGSRERTARSGRVAAEQRDEPSIPEQSTQDIPQDSGNADEPMEM